MSKKKIRVKIIGPDSSTERMFRKKISENFEYVIMKDDITSKPDLLCFTGGEDVNPALYGENPIKETHFNIHRDEVDKKWYDRYSDVPKVGICRGGQFLNVMSGGAMWQHVSNHGMSHDIINLLPIRKDWSQGDLILATSTHHQMMIAGPGGDVIAIAMNKSQTEGLASLYLSGTKRDWPEYDTEVVFYTDTKSLCFQPHPEYYHGSKEQETYFFDLVEYLLLG